MANIKYFFHQDYESNFGGPYEIAINKAHSKVTYTFEDGSTVVLFGDSLKIKLGELASGTVDTVGFYSDTHDTFLFATDVNIKAYRLGMGAINDGGYGIHQQLFTKDDRIIGCEASLESLVGGRGDDYISGGRGFDSIFGGVGDDILRGGQDGDAFAFRGTQKIEHDIIRDFNPDEDDVWLVDCEVTKVRSVNGGDDTLLILSTQSTVLLQDVTKAEWLAYVPLA